MHPASLYHLIEIFAVSALVLGCAVYCAFRLAPETVIRHIRTTLVGLPLPATLKLTLVARRKKHAGCSAACSGCASAASRR
ncbi:MAG: hypothetical protein IPO19_06200 [Rhodoferax sp.]|nr:hypothetical protein [Rhodoferax sp.]